MTHMKIIGTPLYQWEIGRQLQIIPILGMTVDFVHFSNQGDEEALTVKPKEIDGIFVADIPDILLQSGRHLVVHSVNNPNSGCVEIIRDCVFQVRKRAKPADYIYTEPEKMTWEALDERIGALEQGGGGSGGGVDALDKKEQEIDYLHSLVNYGYDDPYDLASSGGTGASCIGIKRNKNVFIVNTLNTNNSGARVKLSNNMMRVARTGTSANTTIDGWENPISLVEGHTYTIKSIYLSGESKTDYPNAISIYKQGEHASIGFSWIGENGKDYYRRFVYDGTPIHVTLNCGANADYTDYKFMVLLVDETALVENSTHEINVKNFGAAGNGTKDDTDALQAALNKGGRIYIPDGVYPISTSLVIYSNTHLILSPKATLLRTANIRCLIHSYCAVDTTEYNGVHDVTIEGGTLDLGTGFTQGAANLAFIHAQNITIRDCTMLHMSKGYHGCDIGGCKNVLIENCIFKDALTTTETACFVQADCPWGQITYTYDGWPDGSPCFDSTPCQQFVVRGCTFYLNELSPAFGNHNDGHHKYIVFEKNFVYGGESPRGAVAFADYTENNYTDLIYIHDNVFSGCKYGFKFTDNGTGRAFIRNNIFENIETLEVNPDSPVGQFDNNITVTTP